MDITLALEHSTDQPSIALIKEGRCLEERCWQTTKADPGRLHREIRDLMVAQQTSLDAVGRYAVGLGPGGFTGLRVCVSAAKALALPQHNPVIGISSAKAIAAAVFQQYPEAHHVMVVGDARRDRIWLTHHTRESLNNNTSEPLHVLPFNEVADYVSNPNGVVATPDWNRLDSRLTQCIPPSVTLLRHRLIPRAVDIAALAQNVTESTLSAQPCEPIYVHPPVFVEPRFTPRPAPPPEASP